MKMGSDLTGICSDLVGMLTVVKAVVYTTSLSLSLKRSAIIPLVGVADAPESGGAAKGGGGQPPLHHDSASQTLFLSAESCIYLSHPSF
ncbi:hypothetical protein HanPSC8_Chr17g0778081 [Helianthus annuus]|nr:hypothetical protein HanPSC8_Chr17g0778081 [Helianthus annuus]